MVDITEFNDLLSKTKNLISKRKNKEDLVRIESNINALKLLSHDIQDENTKQEVLSSLDRMAYSLEYIDLNIDTKDDSKNKNVSKLDVDEQKHRLEKELIETSAILSKRICIFSEKLAEDDNVLSDVHKKITENVVATKNSLKSLEDNISSVSSFRLFMIAILIFFVMYFIIRAV